MFSLVTKLYIQISRPYMSLSTIVLFICISYPSYCMGSTLYLKYCGANLPAFTHQTQVVIAWIEEIESRTSGEVSIKYYPCNTLMGEYEMFDALLRGVIDIGMFHITADTTKFLVMSALLLPLGYSSGSQATEIANSFYQHFQPIELAELKVLYLFSFGPEMLHTKSTSPIYSLDNIADKYIRAHSVNKKMITALGANAIELPLSEIRDFIERGSGDGTFNPMSFLKIMELADFTKFTTKCYSIGRVSILCVAMNKSLWNSDSISDETREIFTKVSTEWIPKHGTTADDADKEGENYALSLGNKMITLSDQQASAWRQKVQPVVDSYIRNANAQGFPGSEYVSFLESLIPHTDIIFVDNSGSCGGQSPCYSTIQEAINAANTDSLILVTEGIYEESLNLTANKSLLIKGGYNSEYNKQTPNKTYINAPGTTQVNLSAGSIKFQMVTIK